MAMLLISTVFGASAAGDITVDGVDYTLDVDGAYVESCAGSRGYSGDLVIPTSVFGYGKDYPVVGLGSWAFGNCYDLTSVTLPNTLVKIKRDAFYYCTGLTSIEIPNSVKTIGDGVFRCCSNLTTIYFGESLTEIGANVFGANLSYEVCSKLTDIYCAATTPPALGENAFTSTMCSVITLYVPSGCVDAYKESQWGDIVNIVEYDFAGVDNVGTIVANAEVVGYYNLQGVMSAEPWDGFNIVKYSDGTSSKLMHK